MAHRQRGPLEVDVAPGETEDLALPKADTEGDEVERLKAVATDRLEEQPRLLG